VGAGVSHEIEKCAFDDVTNRQLFALDLVKPNGIDITDLGSKHFCCLIAWDASQSTVEEVSALVDPLIKAGCVYFVCWGPSCERVHDIIDESDPYEDGVIMTTWHSEESLEETLWFFLNVAWPDKEFEETFGASLAITIGSKDWASEVRIALSDPRAFSKMVLDKEEAVNSSTNYVSSFTKLREWLTKR
jgi:hypothetical protein